MKWSFPFLVRASQGSLVSFSLLRLLHCLLSKSSTVSIAAYTQIRALAAAKDLKLQTLFSQYKNPICQVDNLPIYASVPAVAFFFFFAYI